MKEWRNQAYTSCDINIISAASEFDNKLINILFNFLPIFSNVFHIWYASILFAWIQTKTFENHLKRDTDFFGNYVTENCRFHAMNIHGSLYICKCFYLNRNQNKVTLITISTTTAIYLICNKNIVYTHNVLYMCVRWIYEKTTNLVMWEKREADFMKMTKNSPWNKQKIKWQQLTKIHTWVDSVVLHFFLSLW